MKNVKKLLFVGGLLGAVAQAQDPNLIDVTSLEQLDAIRYDLVGGGVPALTNAAAYRAAFGTPSCPDGCEGYELTANLDFSGTKWGSDCSSGCLDEDGNTTSNTPSVGWDPIGTSYFRATFDGNGHTISNLYINRPNSNNVGLFGSVDGATIRNLGIVGGSVTGESYVGGLVGGGFRFSITACYATGNVTAASNGDGTVYAGGLMGGGNGSITACYATGTVTATSNGDGTVYAGGLVGNPNTHSISPPTDMSITACYATGTVTATSNGSAIAGGLVGRRAQSSSITACYATGNATAGGSTSGSIVAGGLVGQLYGGTIMACYSIGDATATGTNAVAGGLIGFNSGTGTITGSYFDSDVSNRPATDEYAQSTEALQSITRYSSIFEAWDDQEQWTAGGAEHYIWSVCGDDQYPKLNVDFNSDGTPSVGEFGAQGPCTSSFARIIDLETSQTAQDTKITALETSQGAQDTKITDLEAETADILLRAASFARIIDLETSQTAQDTKITDLETSQGTQDTKITALETSQGTQDTKITTLETSQGTQDTKITTLETSQGTQDTKITALETSQTAQDTKITALETSQGTQDTEIAMLKAQIRALEGALSTAGIDIPTNPGGTAPPTTTTIYNVPATSGTAQAYPNPATHTLLFANLTPGSRYVYKVYTPSGALLTSGTIQGNEHVDISTIAEGQYILTLQDNEHEVLRTSLLVERKR